MTADEIGISEEVVKRVISHYWHTVRYALDSFEYLRIRFPFFGTFEMNPFRLKKSVVKYLKDKDFIRMFATERERFVKVWRLYRLYGKQATQKQVRKIRQYDGRYY